MEKYYKVSYREDEVLKCVRYGYEDKYEAIKVADFYASKDNITDVQIYKCEVISTLIKQY